MSTKYPEYNYTTSEDLIRKGWEQQEQAEKEIDRRAEEERERIAKQYPQSTWTRQHETVEGEPFYKTHQQQEMWMAADEKYGRATYDRPQKQLTTLEIHNLRSELKDLNGLIKGVVKEFKQLEARKKQIEVTLGIKESE